MSGADATACWRPTPAQESILDVILLPELEARAAWEAWQPRGRIDDLDAGSYRLLPLLWRRASDLGLAGEAGRLKGLYRRTWYQNQVLLCRAAELIAALEAQGIDTLMLKGAALAAFHYGDLGVRPMDDIDLLIPASREEDVVRLLFDAGWRAEPTPLKGAGPGHASSGLGWVAWAYAGRRPDRFDAAYFDVRHAHGFVGPRSQKVDLHWRVLERHRSPALEERFWAAASAVELHGVSTRILEPADQLVHLCVHAARWGPVPPVRWVTDAAAVLRSAGDSVDWDRLVGIARAHGFALPLGEMLSYLVDRFDLDIPAATLEALRSIPVGRQEREAYRRRVAPPGTRAGIDELRYLRRRHRSLCRHGREQRRFPAFVAAVLGADRPAQVAVYGTYELARRLVHGRIFPYLRTLPRSESFSRPSRAS